MTKTYKAESSWTYLYSLVYDSASNAPWGIWWLPARDDTVTMTSTVPVAP